MSLRLLLPYACCAANLLDLGFDPFQEGLAGGVGLTACPIRDQIHFWMGGVSTTPISGGSASPTPNHHHHHHHRGEQ